MDQLNSEVSQKGTKNKKMNLRGNPKKVDFDGWLDDGTRLHIGADEDRAVLLDFKVTTSTEGGRETMERLLARSVSDPDYVSFRFWVQDGSMFLVLWPLRCEPGPAYMLGEVPKPLYAFVTRAENWSLFENFAEVVSYSVGISLVGKEVDQDRVMGMADFGELDDLSQKEFDKLISSLRDTMSQETYVLKIRLRLSPHPKTGQLPSWGDEKEAINV